LTKLTAKSLFIKISKNP